MLAPSLEHVLTDVFERAQSRGDAVITLEHLLRGLLDDVESSNFLASFGVNVGGMATALDDYVGSMPANVLANMDSAPFVLAVQRTLQRAVFSVQQSGRKEVDCKDVLVSLLSEEGSTAAEVLAKQGVSRKTLTQELGREALDSSQARNVAVLESRLNDIEKKLDLTLAELRALSAAVKRSLEVLPRDN